MGERVHVINSEEGKPAEMTRAIQYLAIDSTTERSAVNATIWQEGQEYPSTFGQIVDIPNVGLHFLIEILKTYNFIYKKYLTL